MKRIRRKGAVLELRPDKAAQSPFSPSQSPATFTGACTQHWARACACTLTTCRHGPVAQHTRNRRITHSAPPRRMAPTRLQQQHSSRYRCGCPRGQKVPTTRSQRARSAKRLLRSQRSRRASRLLQPLDHRLRRAARGKAAAALHRGQAASAASASV